MRGFFLLAFLFSSVLSYKTGFLLRGIVKNNKQEEKDEGAIPSMFPLGMCVATHCSSSMGSCMLESQCRAAMSCTSKCKLDDASCFFMCEMGKGYGSPAFAKVLACMGTNKCFPKFAEDGKCRVTDADGIPSESFVSFFCII